MHSSCLFVAGVIATDHKTKLPLINVHLVQNLCEQPSYVCTSKHIYHCATMQALHMIAIPSYTHALHACLDIHTTHTHICIV